MSKQDKKVITGLTIQLIIGIISGILFGKVGVVITLVTPFLGLIVVLMVLIVLGMISLEVCD